MCPRCGIHNPGKKKGSLCVDCQHSPTNPTYVWAAAKAEVARLARNTTEPT